MVARAESRREVISASCVVVDDERALITSANCTEAAQLRNIESSVLVESSSLARALRRQFEALVQRGAPRPIPS